MLVSSVSAVFAAESRTITVFVDGSEIAFDVPPTSENGRTLVPMRYIFEALGADVNWIAEENKVVATKGEISIELVPGSNIMLKNGKEIVLDVPAKAIEGRTLVPVRAISEALDADVNWIGEEYKVDIKSILKAVDMTEAGARETVQEYLNLVEEMDFVKSVEFLANADEIRAKIPNVTYGEIAADVVANTLTQANDVPAEVKDTVKESLIPLLDDVLKAFAEKTECEITDVKETENGYTYTVSITMPDEESMKNYGKEINAGDLTVAATNALVLSGKITPASTETEIMALVLPEVLKNIIPVLKECIIKADSKTTTQEITVELLNNKWKITAENLSEDIFDLSLFME
jgi:hypothetical protein